MFDILKQKLDEIPGISNNIPAYSMEMDSIFKEGDVDQLLSFIDHLEEGVIQMAITKPRKQLAMFSSRAIDLKFVETELNRLTPCEDITTSFIFI